MWLIWVKCGHITLRKSEWETNRFKWKKWINKDKLFWKFKNIHSNWTSQAQPYKIMNFGVVFDQHLYHSDYQFQGAGESQRFSTGIMCRFILKNCSCVCMASCPRVVVSERQDKNVLLLATRHVCWERNGTLLYNVLSYSNDFNCHFSFEHLKINFFNYLWLREPNSASVDIGGGKKDVDYVKSIVIFVSFKYID